MRVGTKCLVSIVPSEFFLLNFQKGNDQNTLKLRVKGFSLLKVKIPKSLSLLELLLRVL